MLDRNLFDICMGKLTPHAALPATITRYVTAPALTLADIGCYALTLADILRPTPALRWLGLIHAGQACPLPSEQRLLALISQQALILDDERPAAREAELTLSGTRRLGLAPVATPNPHDGQAQPLFFVPPDLIGSLIGPLIGSLIRHGERAVDEQTASTSHEMRSIPHPSGITWESLDHKDIEIPPQPPTAPLTNTGGGAETKTKQRSRAPRGRQPPAVPENETTRLLRTINVLPEQLIELATMPVATVQAAIDDGKARPGIRDLAGWVVKLLRTHRDHGWKIVPPAPAPDSPAALRAAFARYAVEQEAARHQGMPDDQPWFPPPDPEPLNKASATIRLWNQVQSAIKTQLARNEFNTWIRRATLVSVEQRVATIMVPTALAQQVLTERYGGMLGDLLRMYTGEPLELRVLLNPSAPAQSTPLAVDPPVESVPNSQLLTPNSQSPTPNPQPSTWIAAERWAALPIMLRAALAGAELVGGEVQGRTPYLSMLLRTRYEREVGELIKVVLS